MYEFTMGGAWFRWSALDRRSKQLAVVSLVASLGPAIAAGHAYGAHGYRLGWRIGVAMAGGVARRAPTPPSPVPDWLLWLALACTLVSAAAWWRFSLRQDEMFNRVQNWALGMAGAWSLALLGVWTIVAAALGLPSPDPAGAGLVVMTLLIGFWFAAVRRWA